MDASEVLSATRIVPVVVVDDPEQALRLAATLLESGLRFIEVTLRTPAAMGAIERICSELPELVVGAGSVREVGQMSMAKKAGAGFAVSPGASDRLIDAAGEQGLPFVPGAVTASEMIVLLERGYRLQKFFPAELAGGTAMLKSLGGPLPEVRFFPTGGITQKLAADYLALDNVACLGGSWIAPSSLLEKRNFEEVGRRALAASALESRCPRS